MLKGIVEPPLYMMEHGTWWISRFVNLWQTVAMQTRETIDWSELPLIRREPGKLGGAPNIDGMRITPEAIVDNYERGLSIEEIVTEVFSGVTYEQARAILEYAAQQGQLSRPLAA